MEKAGLLEEEGREKCWFCAEGNVEPLQLKAPGLSCVTSFPNIGLFCPFSGELITSEGVPTPSGAGLSDSANTIKVA